MKTLLTISILFFFMVSEKGYSQVLDSTHVTNNSLVGQITPNFAGISLTGVSWDNEKLKDKVVLLNFWYLGCPPCMQEIKYFNQLYEEYRDRDFVMLSIAPQVKEDLVLFNDTVQESVPAVLRNYFQAETIQYEIIPACDTKKFEDPNKVGVECDNITKDFLISAYPTTFLIDKNGVIREEISGFAINEEGQVILDGYKEMIDQLLEK